MKSKTYPAFAYRQGAAPDAPLIVAFVASAEEVVDWAGMPRRSEDDEMAGFQRPHDDHRVEKAKEFFKIAINQSPTAIVVGIHPALSGPIGARLVFVEGDEGHAKSCRLTITWPDADDEIAARVRELIHHRLCTPNPSDGDELDADDLGAQDSSEGEEEDVGYDENDDGDESGGEIELGRSLLEKLQDRMDDEEWCALNADALLDLAKPATVIDGQHRLKGAEKCERNIPFVVCALFDCSWAEQVFQFTVLNYTQKGIPDQFITNNAALSLTQFELGELQERLVQAGVKVVEYELMKVVHFHPDSPFEGLVNLTEKRDKHKIGYKTMVRLARGWFDASHPVFRQILPSLYPDIPNRRQHKTRVARWRQEDWGVFFLDFWRLVHDAYAGHTSHVPGHGLWDVGYSQLIVAIVLFEFQAAFLDALNQQDEEYFKVSLTDGPDAARREMRDRVQKRARKFIEWFEPGFFGTRWAHQSLSIGPGRKALAECFYQLVRTKGNFRYVNSALFSASTVSQG